MPPNTYGTATQLSSDNKQTTSTRSSLVSIYFTYRSIVKQLGNALIHFSTDMSFFADNPIAISALAIKVHAAYKDALNDYGHISDELMELRTLINRVAQHFKSTTISGHDFHSAQKILGCLGVLEDINTLFENFNRLASTNKRFIFTRVKLGKEDI